MDCDTSMFWFGGTSRIPPFASMTSNMAVDLSPMPLMGGMSGKRGADRSAARHFARHFVPLLRGSAGAPNHDNNSHPAGKSRLARGAAAASTSQPRMLAAIARNWLSGAASKSDLTRTKSTLGRLTGSPAWRGSMSPTKMLYAPRRFKVCSTRFNTFRMPCTFSKTAGVALIVSTVAKNTFAPGSRKSLVLL
jgi:hypothetical protein